jgi:hypothetical protein
VGSIFRAERETRRLKRLFGGAQPIGRVL